MAGNGPGALFNREKDPSNNKEKNESKNENLMWKALFAVVQIKLPFKS